MAINSQGISNADILWNNIKNHTIINQNSHEITATLYSICMNYCICADLVNGVKENSGNYFETLVGHLYSMHLLVEPTNQMNAVELDGESISVPTDFILQESQNFMYLQKLPQENDVLKYGLSKEF